MIKNAGADCPKCRDPWPAEHAQQGQPPRWTCNVCGASGELSGQFFGSKAGAPRQEPPPAPVKKHWRAAGLLVLLAACGPALDAVAVDGCLLREYLEECESEMATPEEAAICRKRAPLEAVRPLAGIPADCRGQGDKT